MKLQELHEGKMFDKLKKLFGSFMKKKEAPSDWQTDDGESIDDMHTNEDEAFDFASNEEYDRASRLLKTVDDTPIGGIGTEKSTGDIHIQSLGPKNGPGTSYVISGEKIKKVR